MLEQQTIEDVLWDAVMESPEEAVHKLALADHYEELEIELLTTNGLRWCAANDRHPYLFENIHWTWYCKDNRQPPRGSGRAVLPKSMYYSLHPASKPLPDSSYGWTLKDAFTRIGTALSQIEQAGG